MNFTCDKTNLHNIRGKAEKYSEMRNTAVLIRSAFDELNPNNVELIWKHLHLKTTNFGVGHPEVKVSSELIKCIRPKMHKLLRPFLETAIEQRCTLRAYEDLRNCTSSDCRMYLYSIFRYQEVFYWQFELNDNVGYRVLNTGSLYSGIGHSVVIEPTLLHADYFALLQPFLKEVWILVGVCICVISLAITGTDLKCYVKIVWILQCYWSKGT